MPLLILGGIGLTGLATWAGTGFVKETGNLAMWLVLGMLALLAFLLVRG